MQLLSLQESSHPRRCCLLGGLSSLKPFLFPPSGSILSHTLLRMAILTESQDCRRGLKEEQKFCDKNLGAASILQELSVMSWL